MSAIEDIRKLLQDFLAPELGAIREKITNIEKLETARFEATQAMYATLNTHMELVKQTMALQHDAVMTKLNALTREKAA